MSNGVKFEEKEHQYLADMIHQLDDKIGDLPCKSRGEEIGKNSKHRVRAETKSNIEQQSNKRKLAVIGALATIGGAISSAVITFLLGV